ncbi:MAG: immunoglobulin domain-containing protein [Bryobacteraceae bacterium]|jgi:plastocyanin
MLKRIACALVVVCAGWAATKPVITMQPGSRTAGENTQVTFSVAATGNPAPTYQWQRLSVSSWGNVNCWTANCTFTVAATDNGAQFRVMVSNSAGPVTSAVATLTVDFLDIVTQPTSQKVWAATTATFTVTVRANPVPIAYQWYRQSPGQAPAPIPGAISAVYTTPVTTAQNDQTVYWVSLSNGSYTKTSNFILLTVVSQAPAIANQPKNITAMEGTKVTFTVTASAAPPPTYQWQRWNGSAWANIGGATATSYTLTVWSSDNGALFRAMVTNAAGSTASSPATLTVQFLDVLVEPVSELVAAGTRAAFWVGVTANPLLIAYQWYSQPPGKPGAPIAGATSSSYTTPATTVQNNGTFYWVTMTNTLLKNTSAAVLLTVAVQDLSITTQPASQSVKAGDQVTFSVAAKATLGPIAYQWYKNTSPIPGAIQSSYYIPYAAASDAGSFWVTVSNPLGSLTSSAATLTVGPGGTDLTVWPNSVSRANSDPWIAQNHSQLVKMQPRVLVINFANGLGEGGGDNTTGGPFPPDQILAKAQAFLAAMKYASQYHARLNPSAPAFLDPAIAWVVNLSDSNGHANSNLFPRGPLNANGYPEVGYYQLFSQAYAPYWGFLDPNGNSLTLGQAAALGYFHDILMIANQVDGNGKNPQMQVTNNILQVAIVAQAYNSTLNPIPGVYVKNGIAHNRQTADMSHATGSDDNSMPWTGRSMRIYFVNAASGVGCVMYGEGQEWEFRYTQASIYDPGTAYDNASPNPYMQPLFTRYAGFDMNTQYGVSFPSLYAGGDSYTYTNCVSGVCTTLKALSSKPPVSVPNYKVVAGNVDYPPGAAKARDYYPLSTVLSSIETFGEAAQTAVPVNYHLWDFINQNPAVDDSCGGHWLTFWYQNMPGLNNTTVNPSNSGQPILNWWPFMYY